MLFEELYKITSLAVYFSNITFFFTVGVTNQGSKFFIEKA